jgi:hypothetical protein
LRSGDAFDDVHPSAGGASPDFADYELANSDGMVRRGDVTALGAFTMPDVRPESLRLALATGATILFEPALSRGVSLFAKTMRAKPGLLDDGGAELGG